MVRGDGSPERGEREEDGGQEKRENIIKMKGLKKGKITDLQQEVVSSKKYENYKRQRRNS